MDVTTNLQIGGLVICRVDAVSRRPIVEHVHLCRLVNERIEIRAVGGLGNATIGHAVGNIGAVFLEVQILPCRVGSAEGVVVHQSITTPNIGVPSVAAIISD